jgi:HD-GYP domain-containing protein (c-di-GMP phosphodiesterase class II)
MSYCNSSTTFEYLDKLGMSKLKYGIAMPETKRPLKVFLCHAHADRDAVRALYARLTRDGADAWLDKEKLVPGSDWELEIRKAVRDADVVVVCLTKKFNQAGYRQKEVRIALDEADKQPEGEIFIVPARLEECDTLESLRRWHWVDLFEDDGYERLLRALTVRAEKVKATLKIEKSRAFNVEQLSILQEIDAAIASSHDLRINLQVVLKNISHYLGVDAAAILLWEPSTLKFQYAAGIGFLTPEDRLASLSLGEGAGEKSVLERRVIQIPDLSMAGPESVESSLVEAEKFVACMMVPLIAKGQVIGILEIFQRSTLDMDDETTAFLEILAGRAAMAIDSAMLFDGLGKANLELSLAYETTIEGWLHALEMRDSESHGHTLRVVELTLRLASAMGLPENALLDIRRGALLHDIGKLGIPDSILYKPDQLTEEEMKILRKQPLHAYDMLAPITYLRNALDIPYCQHEKWDGTGYPRGLKGEQIPLAARIFSVVNVFDSLASDKPFRKAWPKDKILDYISEQKGKDFDPQVVDAFVKLMKA